MILHRRSGSTVQGKRMQRFKPGRIWTDDRNRPINAHGGGILYRTGTRTYYWFGEHKNEDGAELRFGEPSSPTEPADGGAHVYSSQDLYAWHDEGLALPVVRDDPAHDLARGCVFERPKVVRSPATGLYVMWFKLFRRGAGYEVCHTGTAVAASPAGPYRYHGKFLAGQSEAGAGDFALFQDDDGRTFHFCSRKPTHEVYAAELQDDCLAPRRPYVRVIAGDNFEAPAVFKRHGKYYMMGSHCTGWEPNPARCAVAEAPLGRWREIGNPCLGEGRERTFDAQVTYVLPVAGRPDAFVFLADRWRPECPAQGRYVWLPIAFEGEQPVVRWINEWDLGWFEGREAEGRRQEAEGRRQEAGGRRQKAGGRGG